MYSCRVEVRVYIQKVKHLEYEHKNGTKRVDGEGESSLIDEKEEHTTRSAFSSFCVCSNVVLGKLN